MNNSRLRFLSVLVWCWLLIPASIGLSNSHPRLILNPDRIADLKNSIMNEHKQLWELTQQSAIEFMQDTIPEMPRANNSFRAIAQTMPALALSYLMTTDEKYLESAESWLTAFLAVPEWTGSANLGRSAWVIACGLLYDWLYDDLDEGLRLQIEERLVREAHNIMAENSSWRALSNHFLIETAALGITGLAFVDSHEEARVFLDKTDEWVQYITDHAPTDGSWGEGVQYWQYGLSHFMIYLEAAASTGHKDYYSNYDWLRLTGFFPIHFALPGKPLEVLNISDCTSGGYKPPFILYLLASVYENGYYQEWGNRLLQSEPHKFNWMDLLTYNPEISPKPIEDLPKLKHFEDNDLVATRSSWQPDATLIGFRCGPAPGHRNQADPLLLERRGYGPGHGHPDINSFSIFAHGEWLAIDPGYTHLKRTDNHNTIIVNGQGQAGALEHWLDFMAFEEREPAPAILRIESNPVYDYILGDAGNIYVDKAKLNSFRRHLLFLKPDIVVIADDLEGKKKRKFEWLIHGRDSTIQTEEDQFEIIRNQARLWIHPILPDQYQANIGERELHASDTDGKVVTLTLVKDRTRTTRFLVVMCALKDATASTPKVGFENDILTIEKDNLMWRVRVVQPSQIKGTADAALVVELPVPPSDQDYSFIRKTE
ncbi:heparinase II/III family protein [Candidatus Neomarinimicrobiota bacterium]